MKYGVFSIRDELLESFRSPFFMESTEAAKRALRVALASPERLDLKDSPSDYSCWLVAHWNSDTALFTPVVPPILVARVRDFLTPEGKGSHVEFNNQEG